MLVVGADVHKRTHTFVAVDEVVVATSARHGEAVMSGARLERDLLTAGQKVVRVPPKLMAQVRASARTRGKSDPIDALAVVRVFLRELD